jgi:hypothetical protein
VLALSWAFTAACANGAGEGEGRRECLAEPLGAVVAFLEEPAPPLSARFTGTFVASRADAEPDAYRYVIRDTTGKDRRLTYRAPGGPLPLQEGASYEFQVDYVGGAPPASGLLIRDGAGLLFAGASDQRLGMHALKEGLPLFTLALLPPTCSGRRTDTCFDAIINVPLRIRSADLTAELHNGESARLGPFRVTCLTAQAVTYSGRCADAGLPAISYIILRAE